MDNDGYITEDELLKMIKMMPRHVNQPNRPHYKDIGDTNLRKMIRHAIYSADTDKDGKINFEEFGNKKVYIIKLNP